MQIKQQQQHKGFIDWLSETISTTNTGYLHTNHDRQSTISRKEANCLRFLFSININTCMPPWCNYAEASMQQLIK